MLYILCRSKSIFAVAGRANAFASSTSKEAYGDEGKLPEIKSQATDKRYGFAGG
jgi:hypothetical protein